MPDDPSKLQTHYKVGLGVAVRRSRRSAATGRTTTPSTSPGGWRASSKPRRKALSSPESRSTVPVEYNPNIPVELFDFIFTDEAHRSIYNLWRQVLEYFDSYLVGLTATASKQTLGFFNQNLVMEYGHEAAVADGVNVPFDVYRIRTQITEGGSKVEAGLYVDKRDRETRAVRWQKLDEDLTCDSAKLSGGLERDAARLELYRSRGRTAR